MSAIPYYLKYAKTAKFSNLGNILLNIDGNAKVIEEFKFNKKCSI